MSIGNLALGQSTGSKSASTLVKTGPGGIQFIFPTASSSGIVAVFDGTDTTGTNLTGSITLAANTPVNINLGFGTGCYVQLVSGTATFFVNYV
jgi:hypothetical protein